MRIVLISDTHGLHDRVPQLPQGDILVHAGDFMNAGYDLREVVSFNRWPSALSRIYPGLLAKNEPLPCTSIAGEAAPPRLQDYLLRGIWARGKQGENVHHGRNESLLVQIETLPSL